MKRFKLNFALAALLAGASLAFASKAPAATKPNPVEWVRTGSTGNPDSDSWLQQSTGLCDESDRICKATFPSGYNPNAHSYSDNAAAATVITPDGYVPTP